MSGEESVLQVISAVVCAPMNRKKHNAKGI